MGDATKTLAIVHGGCADGFAAAWCLRAAYPDAEFHFAHYGEPPPDVTGKRVVIADFSYKRPVMLDLIRAANGRVTVLDHHTTAEKELAGIVAEIEPFTLAAKPEIVFDMGKSGGRLAWEHAWDRDAAAGGSGILNTHEHVTFDNPPWLVRLTEDRDLWRWALPKSREINAALRTWPFDFDVWDRLAATHPLSLAAEGAAVLRAEAKVVESHVNHAREVTLDGYRVLGVNATTLTSEIGEALAAGRPFGVTWFRRADGLFVYSLRSREGGANVAVIAKRFGGGGHAQAAGFESRELLA